MLAEQRLSPTYTIDELVRELRSGIIGWIRPDMEITTEVDIRNDEDLMQLNKQLFELKKLTTKMNIEYQEVVSTGTPILPHNFNRAGLVHIIKINWE